MSIKTVKKADKPAEPQVHFIQKVIGGDTYLVMADSATELEDEFASQYYTANAVSNLVVQPTFDPKTLAKLVTKNNILSQCVSAMEVNVDGTGHQFEPLKEGEEVDKTEASILEDFFNEPVPGESFISIRRKLRRHLESTGYAALEVLRNMANEVVGVRNLESHTLRFVKLDDPVLVERPVMRAGKEVPLKMWVRERRYVQKVANKDYYFKEFGTSRQLNRKTGMWAADGENLDVKDQATELIVFGVLPDVGTPYSIPRWINQLPSVVGSRKAEEQNLEYFDAGGLPPAIIFVQGGTLAKDASDQLRNYLSGKNKNKNRAVVVEAASSSGTLDSTGTVQVKVERFGAEKAGDNMFSNYDKTTEDHVRTGFRLPPLFLGRAADYNYATAVVAYMVAEEQVFQPERIEFDEIINKTLVKALGIKKTKFVSKPITLKNIDAMLKALELAKDKTDGKVFVEEVNKITGTTLTYKEPEPMAAPAVPGQQPAAPAKEKAPAAGKEPAPVDNTLVEGPKKQPKKATELIELAQRYGAMRGLLAVKGELSETDKELILKAVSELGGQERTDFNTLVASFAFGAVDQDLVHLTDCAHAH